MALVAVDGSNATDFEQIGRLRQLFSGAANHRRSRVQQWQRSYRILYGRQWSEMRSTWMPSPQASEVYPIIAALVGWATDQRPGFEVTPSASLFNPIGQQFSQLASDLERVLTSVWIRQCYDAEVEKCLWDGFVYGTGFLKVLWDAGLENGLGDVSMRRVDPFHFYPDPHATSMEDANFFVEARMMSWQELDRKWPGSAERVEADYAAGLDKRDEVYTYSEAQRANPGALSGGTARWGQPGKAGVHAHDAISDRGVTVLEFWLREHKEVKLDDDSDETFLDDHWRVVVLAGNQILMDERATELWSHGAHPYARWVPQDLGEFWGMSLVEHLTPMQLSINRLLAALQSHAELVGNPVLMEDSRSGIQRTKIVNRPGQRITKNAGAEVDWMKPPDMPDGVTELVRFYLGEMERVSGLSAVVRGMTPQGRNAQGVIDSIQEAGFVRVRLALRALERTLTRAGNLVANSIVENYTQPRIVSVLGPTGQPLPQVLQANHWYVPDPEGRRAPLRFTLNVQAGSKQPISRQQRMSEADMLYVSGGIDRQALLEAHDWPDRYAILERIAQAEAAGQFAPPGARERARA